VSAFDLLGNDEPTKEMLDLVAQALVFFEVVGKSEDVAARAISMILKDSCGVNYNAMGTLASRRLEVGFTTPTAWLDGFFSAAFLASKQAHDKIDKIRMLIAQQEEVAERLIPGETVLIEVSRIKELL
jgi:hypothetical protein